MKRPHDPTQSPLLRRKGILRTVALCLVAFVALAAGACSQNFFRKEASSPWSDARQMVVVTTSGWNATDGSLRTFVRDEGGWREIGAATPVAVGRSGSAWGLGLHPAQSNGPGKREGDGRAPAGVFRIGTAFGYANAADTALPYAAMRESSYCMDVAASPLYNRIVDADEVGRAAVAGSTEPMRLDLHNQGDQRYKLGFVIEHNPDAKPGAGSCIFAHLWKAPGQTTAGCTAMAEPAMQRLYGWLEPESQPVFVLLPDAEYLRLKEAWGLPP
ncbi:L,D-transpeptidase family protein [Luteimonas sp. SX5]|uniref:L,D-transpeptidase family protein n=1 Tax=Luteimonas galliterrae TaxID=2940486 RepID=A0ABT0MI69_9GAMM|nr:L,D-transpeptidase family protein [Luteimonas galliterrae]MCL1633949.1 L,D-transpeptidase family protein [Luteimonas galliterrae]